MKYYKKEDLQLLATKLTEKIPDSRNSKEYCQSFIRKKISKPVKQNNYTATKMIWNPYFVEIKSVIIEHPKISHKLSKTIKQAEKVCQVGCNSSLYNDTKKVNIFWIKKKVKITKQAYAFKGFASFYNVEILNPLILSYNLKMLNLQLKIN